MSESFTDQMSQTFLFLKLLTGMLDVSQNPHTHYFSVACTNVAVQRGNKVLSACHNPSYPSCPLSSHLIFV